MLSVLSNQSMALFSVLVLSLLQDGDKHILQGSHNASTQGTPSTHYSFCNCQLHSPDTVKSVCWTHKRDAPAQHNNILCMMKDQQPKPQHLKYVSNTSATAFNTNQLP
jgi:hypothetical protein